MIGFCKSCGAPMNEEFKGSSTLYCKYCIYENGKLKSYEEVRRGIAGFLRMIDSKISEDTAYDCAAHYMKAMPAWAEDNK